MWHRLFVVVATQVLVLPWSCSSSSSTSANNYYERNRSLKWKLHQESQSQSQSQSQQPMEEQEEELQEQWYQRYDWYPEDCSLPEHMESRKIPPIATNQFKDLGATQIRHVTVVQRHGTRTISSDNDDGGDNESKCWDGYWENPETATWDCPLAPLLMPPTPQRILEEEGDHDPLDELFVPNSMLFFNKKYDALQEPQSNLLHGTCQKGQLLKQGYDQAIVNGKHLRDTYLYMEKNGSPLLGSSKDPRLHLFPSTKYNNNDDDDDEFEPWTKASNLYLRSDDHPATLTSGELLFRGLFEDELILSRQRLHQAQSSQQQQQQNYDFTEDTNANTFPMVTVHTADASRDILQGLPETAQCSALTKLQQASDESKEYQHFQSTVRALQAQSLLSQYFYNQSTAQDCLLSSLCSDRPIPDDNTIPNFYSNKEHSVFSNLLKYHVHNHSFHLRYNDAEYSKLNMGPLWAEIMQHILPILNTYAVTHSQHNITLLVDEQGRPVTTNTILDGDNHEQRAQPAKLAIYSGYDSTIMQLLATLRAWEATQWPPYASMLVLEVHEFVKDQRNKKLYPSPFGFRLIYNGKILTEKVPGCTKGKEICDISQLITRVASFATSTVDCVDVTYESTPQELLQDLLTTTGGVVLALLIVAVSALVASMAVFYHLTGVVPTDQDLAELTDQLTHPKKQPGHQRLATVDEDEDDGYDDEGIVLSRIDHRAATDDDLEFNISDASSPLDEDQR